jgi:hypothetical protein
MPMISEISASTDALVPRKPLPFMRDRLSA